MENLKELLVALDNSQGKITMFADGFVDEVWEIVASRTDLSNYTLYSKMNQFAQRISRSGSGGVGLELLAKRRAFGGFTPNIGYAAARLGVKASLIGAYGKDCFDPLFEEVNELCDMYSLDDPAVTHVFEFDDGKLLMSHLGNVQNITWQQIVDTLGIDKIKSLLAESDIIGVGYWSLVPAFDEILVQVCSLIPQDGKKRRFFFDFADFQKKDVSSLNQSLALLKKYNPLFPMTLSVNEHEAAALFAQYDKTLDETDSIKENTEFVRQQIGKADLIKENTEFVRQQIGKADLIKEDTEFVRQQIGKADLIKENTEFVRQQIGKADLIKENTEFVRQHIGFDELIIHTPYYAVGTASTEAPSFAASVFVEKPLRSAGAGDTFNGGYLAASLAGLKMKDRLQIANAAVGYFLRTATFPTTDHLR